MPRRKSNLSKHTRQNRKIRAIRKSLTPEQRLKRNESNRIRIAASRSQEPVEQLVEHLQSRDDMADVEKKSRGRPGKAAKKEEVADVPSPKDRKRGRPSASKENHDTSIKETKNDTNGDVPAKRGRGRPPKKGGPAVRKVKGASGRGRGRPPNKKKESEPEESEEEEKAAEAEDDAEEEEDEEEENEESS